jgi:hypothetical protein
MKIDLCLVETLATVCYYWLQYANTKQSVFHLIISQKPYNDGLTTMTTMTTLYKACCFYSTQLIK